MPREIQAAGVVRDTANTHNCRTIERNTRVNGIEGNLAKIKEIAQDVYGNIGSGFSEDVIAPFR